MQASASQEQVGNTSGYTEEHLLCPLTLRLPIYKILIMKDLACQVYINNTLGYTEEYLLLRLLSALWNLDYVSICINCIYLYIWLAVPHIVRNTHTIIHTLTPTSPWCRGKALWTILPHHGTLRTEQLATHIHTPIYIYIYISSKLVINWRILIALLTDCLLTAT